MGGRRGQELLRILKTHLEGIFLQGDVEELLCYLIADNSCAVECGGTDQLAGQALLELFVIIVGIDEDVGIEKYFTAHSSRPG